MGATHAVKNVSFEINEGSLLVLLGPSGCGKSTTLRLIAGLESVSGGRIYIGDRDVTDLPPAERHLAMVFQSYALFPHLTVRENILFGLKVRKVPEADQMRRLDNAVDVLGLSGLLERKPSALSGGQQQRVALAVRLWPKRQCASWTNRSQTLMPSSGSKCGAKSATCNSAWA